MCLLNEKQGEAAVLQKRVCVSGEFDGLKVPKGENLQVTLLALKKEGKRYTQMYAQKYFL